MRLFYALTFPQSTLKKLSAVQDELQMRMGTGKRTPEKNLHLTLSFLGEQDPSTLSTLKAILDELPSANLLVHFTHLGVFDKPDGAILWAALAQSQPLSVLQRTLVQALKREHIGGVDPRFTAHVTLYRRSRIERVEQQLDISSPAECVALMHSHQVDGVLTYSPIKRKFLQ